MIKVNKNLTAEEIINKRRRNREHAQLSRLRKRMLISSLEEKVNNLQRENDRLVHVIKDNLPEIADTILNVLQPPPPPTYKEDNVNPLVEPEESRNKYVLPPLDVYDIDLINILNE